jgi:hypothetical protein
MSSYKRSEISLVDTKLIREILEDIIRSEKFHSLKVYEDRRGSIKLIGYLNTDTGRFVDLYIERKGALQFLITRSNQPYLLKDREQYANEMMKREKMWIDNNIVTYKDAYIEKQYKLYIIHQINSTELPLSKLKDFFTGIIKETSYLVHNAYHLDVNS